MSAWSAYDVKAEIEEILPTLEPKPTLLLACGRAHPVSMHLLTLGAPENVITPCYRCCSKHHGANVLTVDADPRQLPDIFADFNQKRFWCMLPDDSFKEVLLEEPDIAKGWDEVKKEFVRDMPLRKTRLKILRDAWSGVVLSSAEQGF